MGEINFGQFNQMKEAIKQAERVLNVSEIMAEDMAVLLSSRLRAASRTRRGCDAIVEIKKELKKFNSKTRQWDK